MIDAFVRDCGGGRVEVPNVVPDETAEWIKGLQAKTWRLGGTMHSELAADG